MGDYNRMVKQWRKTETPCFAFLADRGRGCRGKGPLHRVISFYLAILLLFLTSCIHLLNTFTPQWFCRINPVVPSISGSGCFSDLRQASVSSPCLAYFFFHALNATKITILAFALSLLIVLCNILLPYQYISFGRDESSACFIRGPPYGAHIRTHALF